MDYITQFDSLSDDYDSEIDDTYFQWAIDNQVDYLPGENEQDYPESFKEYFIKNCID